MKKFSVNKLHLLGIIHYQQCMKRKNSVRIHGFVSVSTLWSSLCDIRYKVKRISEIKSPEMSTNQVIGCDIDWNMNEMLRIWQWHIV